MAAGRIVLEGYMPALDANANPLSGAKATFYLNGTTTLTAVYSDYELTTPLTNPVVADSAGRFPSIYADAALQFSVKVTNAAGSLQGTLNDVRAIGPGGGDGEGGTSYANILDYGAVGDGETDDTEAFLAARAAAPHVYFPGGYHYILNFTYADSAFSGAALTSGTTLSGDGPTSIISPTPDNIYAAIGCDSGSSSAWVENITIRDLKFLGDVEGAGHSEFTHLVFLSGVKNVVIERCQFVGAQGDGLILASGAGGPSFERHNFDVLVSGCFFDGVLYGAVGGRNPISLIDVNGCVIEGSTFTRWGQSDMPGGIDMEPDQSFGIIKNVRITNNKFSLCGGNRGHVIIATDNIANANWQNIIVESNHFAGNSAVCIYCATTISTVPNNVIIESNTMTDCEYVLEKVNGSIYGLAFVANMCAATTSGYGRFLASAEPSKFTLKDWTIADNVMVAVGAVTNGIADDIEGLRITGNTFRGATQAHWRIGQSGSTYTYAVVTGNTFMGTPSNGAIQADGNTTATLNFYSDNIGPVTMAGSFRATRGDYLGTSGNYLLAAALPSAYPYGVSVIRIANDAVITGDDSGWMITYKQSSHSGEAVWQEFIPFHSATNANTRYMRKAVDLTTWGEWSSVGTVRSYSASLTPASVSANSTSEQTFAVTGLRAGDRIVVSGPAPTAGTILGSARVSATNTVAIQWANVTGGSLTPAAGTYLFLAAQQ